MQYYEYVFTVNEIRILITFVQLTAGLKSQYNVSGMNDDLHKTWNNHVHVSIFPPKKSNNSDEDVDHILYHIFRGSKVKNIQKQQ